MINSRRTAFAARRFPVKLGFIGLSRSVILSERSESKDPFFPKKRTDSSTSQENSWNFPASLRMTS